MEEGSTNCNRPAPNVFVLKGDHTFRSVDASTTKLVAAGPLMPKPQSAVGNTLRILKERHKLPA